MSTQAIQTNTAASKGSVVVSSSYAVSAEGTQGAKNMECDVGGSAGGSVTVGVRGFAFATAEAAIFMQTDPGDFDFAVVPAGEYFVRLNVTAEMFTPEVIEVSISILDESNNLVTQIGLAEPGEAIDDTGVRTFSVSCGQAVMFADYTFFVEIALASTQSVSSAFVTFTKDQDFTVPTEDAGTPSAKRISTVPGLGGYWKRSRGHGGF